MRRWTIALVAALAVGILVGVSAGAYEAFVAAARWLQQGASAQGELAVAVFLVLALVSSLVSPVSSGPLVPSAVLAWGRGWTLVLLVAGWMAGGALAWWLGRAGRARFLARSERLRKVERRLRELPSKRSFVVALALRVALPSEVGYAYGLVRYPLLPYLAITLAAEIPSALLLVYVSDALLQRRLGFVLAGAGLALAVLAIVLLRPHWQAGDARPARPGGR